jgi:hypothetical protein
MSDPAAVLPEATRIDAPRGADERARARIERQLQVLDELVDIALEVARAVERRARDAAAEADIGGLTSACAKATRAVRLTVLLQSRLIKELQGIENMAEIRARTAAAVELARLEDPVFGQKARVERIVERVVRDACGGDDPGVERLMIEACDRLDDEDLYGLVLSRPVGELVALVCRDLGLHPDWARLAEESWAREEIESEAAGSPFIDAGTGSAEGRPWPPDRGHAPAQPVPARPPPPPPDPP